MIRGMAMLVAVALVLWGCSGDDDAPGPGVGGTSSGGGATAGGGGDAGAGAGAGGGTGATGPGVCGNGACEADETCTDCLADCGACPREMIPGVRGFADTTGPFEGQGDPAICIVDTLSWNDDALVVDSDYGGSGLSVLKGSLRRCLDDTDQITAGQGRIVLFEVGGTINANGPYVSLRLRDLDQTPRGIGNIWVAGQTAPPPGITLYNVKIISHGHHTIWQHLRFRLDDNGLDCLEAQNHKGFQAIPYSSDPEPEHTIFDHNSVTYGIDNLVSFSSHSTVTNNILAFALHQSVHPKTHDYGVASASCPGDCECQYGESLNGHSKGVMMTGASRVALVGNIMAFNEDRNPLLQGGVQEIYLANNVTHRVIFPIMVGGSSGPQTITAVGNVAQQTWSGSPNFVTIWREPVMPDGVLYFEDNMCEGVAQTSADDWSSVRLASDVTDAAKTTDATLAASVAGFTPLASSATRAHVLAHAGARPAALDAVDALVVDRVTNETGGFIDAPEDLPDPFPDMGASTSRNLASGMTGAGQWPIPTSPFGDSDGDGRLDIVEWLNQLDEEVGGNDNPTEYP